MLNIQEIEDFLKTVEDTKPNIANLVQVSINEFNNSSVEKLHNKSKEVNNGRLKK